MIYSHGGCLGDIISALPTIWALADRDGPVDLCTYPGKGPREPMTPQLTDIIRPLLLQQACIRQVYWRSRPEGTLLDSWRLQAFKDPYNLADRHLDVFGLPHRLRDAPFLAVQSPVVLPDAKVIFCRTRRMHNPEFPWKAIYAKYNESAVFVGLADEYTAFCQEIGHVRWHKTINLLEAARVVAGCELVVSNQTCIFWLAEGLKKPIISEVALRASDRTQDIPRPGSYYVASENPALEDLNPIRPSQLQTMLGQPEIPASPPRKRPAKPHLQAVRSITKPPLQQYKQSAYFGFLPDGQGGYHCAYREFTPKFSAIETAIRYQHYTAEFKPDGVNKLLVPGGEDPRCFMFKGRYFASFIRPQLDRGATESKEWQTAILDILTGEIIDLPNTFAWSGKNWAPVVGGDDLLYVRALSPLSVARVTTEGVLESLTGPDLAFGLIGQNRPGGYATLKDGVITGIGRRTIDRPLQHIPFIYKIDTRDWSLRITPVPLDHDENYQVVDPTCQIGDRVVCSVCQQSWWTPDQPVDTLLCDVVCP